MYIDNIVLFTIFIIALYFYNYKHLFISVAEKRFDTLCTQHIHTWQTDISYLA